ncbi:hypothetical protein BU14_0222s0010 [Porphyra umbilicalis]|uniref:Uncharacterized protein n=1 Tax=Porphyra umbilicalis TaxID=2786 RepID=A0A1X6P4T6_PORUM|nr:hypothetical protein BU14_0222s0010 [Porphyra umbilicalis]|eukprot:OSX75765.1 hypothetical protein BU14_0222s0010 [Porphyra umbilicalis]
MSLTKAFTLGRTQTGRLSIIKNKETRFEPRYMAGIEFGESAPGEIPNSDVVRRGLHKRLEKASATKHKGHVDRIGALMSTLSGPVGSVRLDAHNLRNGSTGQPGVAGASTSAPRVGRVEEHQLTVAEMRGGPGLASASDEDVAFNRLGPAELSESLGVFVYGPSLSTERSGFVGKARSGMEAQFVWGHNVSGSSLTVTAVAALILSKWGDAGEDHPSIGDLPAGLVDTVTRWVSSRR